MQMAGVGEPNTCQKLGPTCVCLALPLRDGRTAFHSVFTNPITVFVLLPKPKALPPQRQDMALVRYALDILPPPRAQHVRTAVYEIEVVERFGLPLILPTIQVQHDITN